MPTIHPSAEIATSASVGESTLVWHDVQIRENASIGNHCILGKGAYIDEDVVIGNNVKIQNRASIYKECTIEDGVFIGPHACITNDVRPRAINVDGSLKTAADWQPGHTVIRYGASVGAGAIILPGITIGRFALIGAGAIVTRSVPDHALVIGNPARIAGWVCSCGSRLMPVSGGWECSRCHLKFAGNDAGVGPALPVTPATAPALRLVTIESERITPMPGTTISASPAGIATPTDSPPATVAVVGLGKVGLPLAVHYAHAGLPVTGCDIDPYVVAAVNEGRSPIGNEDHLETLLADVHQRQLLTAVTDTAAGVRNARVVVVIVPMMVRDDHSIDFRAIDAATRAIGAGLQPGTLVIYETTLPVGTTRNRFGSMLQEISGLTPGVDFSLAFSPERIRTGQIFHDLAAYPKVVGGIDTLSTQQAAAFYRTVLSAPVMTVSSSEAAELTKLIETAYRDVNIALANEFAMFADARGIDVHEAIAAANSQPQSSIHEPGVGVGGHCIPVYPYFLMQDAQRTELLLSRHARSINDDMADYAIRQIASKLGSLTDRSIVILGLAYRANVREAAFSSALRLIDGLREQGARVYINDPLFTDAELAATGAIPIDLKDIQLVDAIIVQAHHQQYTALNADFYRRASVVLDGRGNTNLASMALGETTLIRIGAPSASPSMIA